MGFKIVEILRPLARVGQFNFTDMNGMQVGGGFFELRIANCALRPAPDQKSTSGRGKREEYDRGRGGIRMRMAMQMGDEEGDGKDEDIKEEDEEDE